MYSHAFVLRMMTHKGFQPLQVTLEVISSKLTWCSCLSRMFVHTSGLSINLLTAIARRHAQILITPSVGKAHAGDASTADVCMLMVLPLLSCRCPVHLPLYWSFMLAMLVSLQFGRSMGGRGRAAKLQLVVLGLGRCKVPEFSELAQSGLRAPPGLGGLGATMGDARTRSREVTGVPGPQSGNQLGCFDLFCEGWGGAFGTVWCRSLRSCRKPQVTPAPLRRTTRWSGKARGRAPMLPPPTRNSKRDAWKEIGR